MWPTWTRAEQFQARVGRQLVEADPGASRRDGLAAVQLDSIGREQDGREGGEG